MKEVVFVCSTCQYYNKANLGMSGFDFRTHETISLNDAIREHVNKEHQVHIEYRDLDEED